MVIQPVILAGGSGTRLWQLSRETYPKQFLKLLNEHSLLQETALRIKHLKNSTNPILVCNEIHYFQSLEQLKLEGLQSRLSMLETITVRNFSPLLIRIPMRLAAGIFIY